ncbi:MAG: DUF255 domain-containing protein [Nanoarchaeota archaeon]|nr:DUF255 domain-containing protein [DPANN group archaeon]MBL7116206.1 DUF255 domain-containing protein [Nanoarchaeota archaeon]
MKKSILIFFIIVFLTLAIVSAESKYTREHSEELFHLIDWQNYTPSTFDKALKEQKPIFLMISAPAWCYWCHVYESKDYLYHPDLYPYINENFITIFVDSDKRPDLTRKYLEGGWPSTTIFSPDFRRINGFTGPRDPFGLRDYFEQIVAYLSDKSFIGLGYQLNYQEVTTKIPEKSQLLLIEANLLSYFTNQFDRTYGGFGPNNAPEWREGQKFPAGFTYKYILEKFEETGKQEYLDLVKLTFDNQYTDIAELEARYRLYDPVEGGFHRYSTNRDWSIPHYEKMLFDQAKLIRAYAHLLKITNDSNVEIAVNGSVSFVINEFYDEEGGFYSSQDAYLEEEYFGLSAEEREKIDPPYIDRTRNMDSNSMMISTFLYLYSAYGNEAYQDIAEKSLNFLKNNMIGSEGAYYYFDYDKKDAFLTGQAVSNSWAILAFLEGYDTLGEEDYLETARKVADYSLANLYDWNSGGFFERNSKDTEFYAPNERIDLSKPYGENAVYSYAMLKLYLETKELEYLESGLKTLGYLFDRISGVDETYYFIKASLLVKDNNLLSVYADNKEEVDRLVEQKRDSFFLEALLEQEQKGVSLDDAPKLRDEFTNVGFIVLAILAFAAGILSFLSPCCLPVLSAYFAHNVNANKGEILKNTAFFFFGLAIVFSIFGMGATLVGNLFRENRLVFTQVAGAVIIVFGVLEIFGKGFSGLQINLKRNKKTPLGSFLFGGVFAIGWSACIGPILASLLLLSATTGTAFKGSGLLFIYALGLAIPLILVSLYFDRIKNKRFWRILKGRTIKFKILGKQVKVHSTYLISGLILIIIGVLIFNDYLYRLNQLALQSTYVQEIIIKGEEFLKNLFIR